MLRSCAIFVAMEFLTEYNLTGLAIGIATFLIIGLFHPLVIKGEYHFGVRCWWVFLVMGIGAVAGSVAVRDILWSTLLAVWALRRSGRSASCSNSASAWKKAGFPKRTTSERMLQISLLLAVAVCDRLFAGRQFRRREREAGTCYGETSFHGRCDAAFAPGGSGPAGKRV